jgi:hypothetical protein
MNISQLRRNDRLCAAVTGLTSYEFERLIPEFSWNLHEVLVTRRNDRKRKMGAGPKGKLPTVEEKLALILFYLKAYTTYDIVGFIFNLHRSNSYRDIQIYMKALEKTLRRKLALPTRKITSIDEFFRKFPEAKEVFADAYERRVQKPINKKKRKKLYSGKKKATTRKNMVVTNIDKQILVLSPTNSGRRHDKRLADKHDVVRYIPESIPIFTDTGLQGLQKIHKNTIIPTKSTKKHPLTYTQKETNRLISGLRVIAEHAIAGIKRYKASSDIYRNRLPNLDDTFQLLSAGLWNYHLSFK